MIYIVAQNSRKFDEETEWNVLDSWDTDHVQSKSLCVLFGLMKNCKTNRQFPQKKIIMFIIVIQRTYLDYLSERRRSFKLFKSNLSFPVRPI